MNLYLINRLKFKGNQYLFQSGSHFKRKDKSKKEKGSPVHHEKALFPLCHIVVLVVKIIYGTGIGNDVMEGMELDYVELRYIERNPNIKFSQNIADTKWISGTYRIFN